MTVVQKQQRDLQLERSGSAQLDKQQQQIKAQMAAREDQLMRSEEQVGCCNNDAEASL
jgi:hypothetical protein